MWLPEATMASARTDQEMPCTWCCAHRDAQGCRSLDGDIVVTSRWLDNKLELLGAPDCLFVNKAGGWNKYVCI